MPQWRRKTMSSAKAWRSDSSFIADPPNLTTMVLPEKRVSHGRASTNTPALARASRSRDGSAGPIVSGSRGTLSLLMRGSCSRRVRRVLVHVGLGEVGGADGERFAAGLEVDPDVDPSRRHVHPLAGLTGSAVAADLHPVDRH